MLKKNNITEANVKTMVDDVNTKFFNKHSIHLDLDIKEYNYSGNDQERNRVLTGLSSLSRSDEDPKTELSQDQIDQIDKNKKKRIELYQDLVQDYTNNSINIYMVTFTGNTRQGNAGVNKNSSLGECEYTIDGNNLVKKPYPMIVLGTWSNKQNGKETIPLDRSTLINHNEGIPTLSFTLAHEITHILGLNHLNTTVNNIMNATTSSFIITDDQKNKIIKISKMYLKHFSKCKELATAAPPPITTAAPPSTAAPTTTFTTAPGRTTAAPTTTFTTTPGRTTAAPTTTFTTAPGRTTAAPPPITTAAPPSTAAPPPITAAPPSTAAPTSTAAPPITTALGEATMRPAINTFITKQTSKFKILELGNPYYWGKNNNKCN